MSTLDGRHAFEWNLDSKIAAGDHDGVKRILIAARDSPLPAFRFSPAQGRRNGTAARTSSAASGPRTNDSATQSTPARARVNASRSRGVRAGIDSGVSGRFRPLLAAAFLR